MTIREMTAEDFDEVLALWRATDGLGLGTSDTREKITHFLERNPGLSYVAQQGKALVGAVLCGHEGRRGYIHHLAVDRNHRGHGLGNELVEKCLRGLEALDIEKCHVFVYRDNSEGIEFWKRKSWTERTELVILSKSVKNEV